MRRTPCLAHKTSTQLTDEEVCSHEQGADERRPSLALPEPHEQLRVEDTEGEEASISTNVTGEGGETDDPAPASVGGYPVLQ